jgi:hypothetical protein
MTDADGRRAGVESLSSSAIGGDLKRLGQKDRIDAYERLLKEKLYSKSTSLVKRGVCRCLPAPWRATARRPPLTGV